MKTKQKKRSSAKNIILDFSKKLKYNDACSGKAIKRYQEQLEEIAQYADEMESLGFNIVIDCKPEKYGRTVIFLEKKGKKIKIYSKFYDTFESGDYYDWNGLGFKQKIEEIIRMAKILS